VNRDETDSAAEERAALWQRQSDAMIEAAYPATGKASSPDWQAGFRAGWGASREALLSDEAVERGARALYENSAEAQWSWEELRDGWKNKPYPDFPHLYETYVGNAVLDAAVSDDG
jgi:hypothetical protein